MKDARLKLEKVECRRAAFLRQIIRIRRILLFGQTGSFWWARDRSQAEKDSVSNVVDSSQQSKRIALCSTQGGVGCFLRI